jgi:hypothetical protein
MPLSVTAVLRSYDPPLGVFRRSEEKRLGEPLEEATGALDDQIVISIREVPPSQAMEMANIIPDVVGP